MISKLIPVLLVGWLAVFLAPTLEVAAMEESEYIKERVKAHTSVVPMHEHPYRYYLVMRKLFRWVQFGKTYGLSQSDIDIVRASRHQPSLGDAAMKPYEDHQLKQTIQADSPSPVDIGVRLNKSRDAELATQEEYYRKVVASLSEQGQTILQKLYGSKINTSRPVRVVDFASLAADVPEYVLEIGSGNHGLRIKAENRAEVPPGHVGKVIFKGQK